MRVTRRVVPLVIGVTAAIGIAGVAAIALPGMVAAPPVVEDPVSADAAAATIEATVDEPSVDEAPPKEEATKTPEVDLEKVAKARDSFPDVPKEDQEAKEAKQAERVAQKKAEEKAAAEKAAAEKAAKDAARKEAAEKEAAKQQQKKEQEAAEKDKASKDAAEKDKAEKDKAEKEHVAWWPEHVWAHLQSCSSVDLDAGTVTGTWHLWLKHGGDWTYVSASAAPDSVHDHGDKVRLDYATTATVVKTHDGWSKAKAGPVSVTVAGPDSQTKTFTVDLWAKVDADGVCR